MAERARNLKLFLLQMSDYVKPCIYNQNSINTQWINNICSSHDLFCGCENPINHLKAALKEKCHHSKDIGIGTDHGEDGEKDDFTLQPGDLEDLFRVEEEDAR
nr:MAG: hypothetical protein [Betatorquevirus sp.]